MKTMKIVCFIVLIYLSRINCDSDTISFIRDFLLHDKKLSSVVGMLCWKQDYILKLMKSLSFEDVLMNVRFDCEKNDLYYPGHKHLYILDINCDFAGKCLKMAESLKLFSSPYKWIILDRNNEKRYSKLNENSIIGIEQSVSGSIFLGTNQTMTQKTKNTEINYDIYLKDFTILTDSNMIIFSGDSQDGSFKLTEYFKRRVNKTAIYSNYGVWNRGVGVIDKRLTPILSRRRINLEGTLLTVSIIISNNDSLNHLTDYRYTEVDTLTKVNYALTISLMEFLNSSSSFSHVREWGSQGPGGNWSGMIGRLVEKQADIGGTPLFLLINRVDLLEYISMTTATEAKFVFRQPPLSYVSNIFVLPFRWTVWGAIAILVLLACISLYAISNLETKHIIKEEKGVGKVQGWGDVVLLAIGAVAQQGPDSEPKSLAGRITTLLLFIFLMFIYTSYSANIVALLQSQSNTINTLEELLNSRIKLGVEDTVYNRFYFPRASDPVRKAIWNKKIAPKNSKPKFLPLAEGVEKIRKGLFALHMEVGVGYKIMGDTFHEDEKCGLREIQFLDATNPWYAIQKNSSFTEIIKIGMRRIQEVGIQSRELQKMYTKRPVCGTNAGRFVSVGLVEIGPALIWLLFGVSLALILLLLETLYQTALIHIS